MLPRSSSARASSSEVAAVTLVVGRTPGSPAAPVRECARGGRRNVATAPAAARRRQVHPVVRRPRRLPQRSLGARALLSPGLSASGSTQPLGPGRSDEAIDEADYECGGRNEKAEERTVATTLASGQFLHYGDGKGTEEAEGKCDASGDEPHLQRIAEHHDLPPRRRPTRRG